MMKKLKWMLPTALLPVLLAGAVWQVMEKQMTQRGLQQFQQVLQGMGVQERVRWEDFKVSPFGTLTLTQLNIALPQNEHFKAEQLRVSDVLDEPDHQRIHLQITQGGMVFSEQALQNLPENFPKNFFNPADMHIKLDFNFASNKGELLYATEQEGMGDFSLHLHISRIGALRGVLAVLFPQSASATSANLDPGLIGLNRVAALYAISLDALDSRVKDRGAVKGFTDMAKQNLAKTALKNGQSAEQAFAESLQGFKQSCEQGGDALKAHCQSLLRFVSAEQDSLQLTAQPAQPVSLEQLEQATAVPLQRSPLDTLAALSQLLNVHLK